jgi:hypothetical protein
MGQLRNELHADRPHEALGDHARVFDRFVGRWDCDYTHLEEDGSVRERYPGHVTFGWILDGQALQDVWAGDRGDGRGEHLVGTSIRFFDTGEDRWTVVWILPEAAAVVTVYGGRVDDRIVLEGSNPDGSLRRWSFDDIRDESFIWRGERSLDSGRTWTLLADYRMTRRA